MAELDQNQNQTDTGTAEATPTPLDSILDTPAADVPAQEQEAELGGPPLEDIFQALTMTITGPRKFERHPNGMFKKGSGGRVAGSQEQAAGDAD